MIKEGSRVRIVKSQYYAGKERTVIQTRDLHNSRVIATMSLQDGKIVKFYVHNLEELPMKELPDIEKEETQMKLYSVTKVTALKDGGFVIEKKDVVAADEDAAKMKSGLMLTNVEDADYATWHVGVLANVKTRESEK